MERVTEPDSCEGQRNTRQGDDEELLEFQLEGVGFSSPSEEDTQSHQDEQEAGNGRERLDEVQIVADKCVVSKLNDHLRQRLEQNKDDGTLCIDIVR